MRISDWSSDVCSSDLRDGPTDCVAAEQRALRTLEHLDPLDIHQVLVRTDRPREVNAIKIDADARIDVESEIVRTDPANIGRQHRRRAGEWRDRKSTRLNSSH